MVNFSFFYLSLESLSKLFQQNFSHFTDKAIKIIDFSILSLINLFCVSLTCTIIIIANNF